MWLKWNGLIDRYVCSVVLDGCGEAGGCSERKLIGLVCPVLCVLCALNGWMDAIQSNGRMLGQRHGEGGAGAGEQPRRLPRPDARYRQVCRSAQRAPAVEKKLPKKMRLGFLRKKNEKKKNGLNLRNKARSWIPPTLKPLIKVLGSKVATR